MMTKWRMMVTDDLEMSGRGVLPSVFAATWALGRAFAAPPVAKTAAAAVDDVFVGGSKFFQFLNILNS